jgi:hypothetical protein
LKRVFLISIVVACFFSSCKKDKLITDPSAKLNFSTESVLFDTVFTTIGSATRHFRVINNNDQKINISSIYVAKGSSSQFILNVDGAPGNEHHDIEIAAHDSMYIFVQVNVNPTSSNSPLVIEDAIVFNTNGNEQTVKLEAWGQDAYYHHPTNAIKFVNGGYLAYSTVSSGTNVTVTWNPDKPHVVYGWLVVDSTQTLLINPGVKVHFHQNAGLWVYRYGTLKVKGAPGNEVIFQGDRLEPYMQYVAGQWDRIWINEGSEDNEIDYAIIKNGFIGVQADLLGNDISAPHRLRITNTKIFNMSKWGIYGFAANIYGGNNVVANCKENCGYFILGGNYTFIHSTFANYWTEDSRSTPSVFINNHTDTQILPLDTCFFGNCIIDGNIANELELDLNATGPATLQPRYVFSNTVLKTTIVTSGNPAAFVDCRIGAAVYNNTGSWDFGLQGTSAASGLTASAAYTLAATTFSRDIIGAARPTFSPGLDAGAYEQ